MLLFMHRGRWRTERLLAVLAAFLVTATILVVGDVRLASAAPNDPRRPFATYNMQGSLNGARWTSEVGPLAERFPVVALQEAGSGPPPIPDNMADDSLSIPIPGIPPHPNMPRAVNRSLWEYNGDYYTVYFLQTHVTRDANGNLSWNGQRVNLAVVTQGYADEVRVVENPSFDPQNGDNYRARRALGIRLGDTVYYNIHGRGGQDTQQLLTAIRNDVRPGEHYVILGDYNVDILNQSDQTARDTVGVQPGEHLARPGRATHQSGHELDYAITRGTAIMNARVPEGRGPDHYYVEFTPPATQVPPAAPAVAHTFSIGFTNVATGTALDIPDDDSRRVITHPQRYNEQQRFNLATVQGHWYMFLHGSGDALSAATTSLAAELLCPGIVPGLEILVVMQPCDNITAQWTPEDPEAVNDPEGAQATDGGPVRWRNSFRPQLCLTATGAQAPVVALPCAGLDAQLWWDNARHVPSSAWVTGDHAVRLRAFNGSYLDAQGGGTDDLTNVTIHPRKDVDNQLWDIQYGDIGDNLVRVRGVPSGKCVDVLESDTAGPGASSIIYSCDDSSTKNDDAGHQWLAESNDDGLTLRFRNDATHLCLVAPDEDKGQVTVDHCSDDPRQVWGMEL